MIYSMYVGVRGQFVSIILSYHVGPGDQIWQAWVIRRGSKCLYLLTHLAEPNEYFLRPQSPRQLALATS